MKKVIFASVFALTLVACGGGNKATQLTKMCVTAEWSTRAGCECISNLAIKELDGDVVDAALMSDAAATKMALESKFNFGKVDEYMQQMLKFMTFLMKAIPTCSAE